MDTSVALLGRGAFVLIERFANGSLYQINKSVRKYVDALVKRGLKVRNDHLKIVSAEVGGMGEGVCGNRDVGARCMVRGDAVDVPEDDPLIAAIQRYRDALDDYSTNAPDDNEGWNAYASRSYVGPRNALITWSRPAVSRSGALAALRMAVAADWEGDYQLVSPMVEAALAFISREWGA